MNCDIIIPIWNQLIFTKDCLEHILKNTKYSYRLILVDNASDRETKEYLEKFASDHSDKTKLIRNEENLGYIKAINQGLAISDASYVCMMNNDTVPAPGWLERMVEFAVAHPDVGLINPQCGGHGNTPVDTYAKSLERHRGEYMEMNQCQGFCMLVPREVIKKIGNLDEAFGVGGFDDTDYSKRAHKAGYRSVSIRDSYVYHRIHASFDKAGNREEVVQRNQKIYYDKWGKHLRVGVIFSLDKIDDPSLPRLIEFVYGLAREWSWVHVWINSTAAEDTIRRSIDEAMNQKGLMLHQNIRINHFNMPGFLFDLTISGKMVERLRKRMKDKRFDAMISFDDKGGALMKPVAKMLGVRMMRPPSGGASRDWLQEGRNAALAIKEARDGKK